MVAEKPLSSTHFRGCLAHSQPIEQLLGKTELLAQKACYLLQTNTCRAPRKILAISFKRDAARNLKERVKERLDEELSHRFESHTFDAFARSIVDRFIAAIPEWLRPDRNFEIATPNWQDWARFGQNPNLGTDYENETFGQDIVEKFHAFSGAHPQPFPLSKPAPNTPVEALTLKWWEQSLRLEPNALTFDMIKMLALTVIEHNPQIKAAMLATYSHVFLDEFQDTNSIQYALLKSIFKDSDAIMTSVGDNKQLIMSWAGASNARFNEFINDFGADTISLASNFRSNRRLVEIVNSMAKNIEPDAVEVTCARSEDELPKFTDGLVNLENSTNQADKLAEFISSQLTNTDLLPEDFLILIRQKADEIEDTLDEPFTNCSLSLRNEARVLKTSKISIQDITTDPFSELVLRTIQVAVEDRRNRDRKNSPYLRLLELLDGVFATGSDREKVQHTIEQSLATLNKIIKAELISMPNSADIKNIVTVIGRHFGVPNLRRLSEEYKNAKRFTAVATGTVEFLKECADGSRNWFALIDKFEGKDQVRMMTIHKSKGLEAHTVIFLNLQDNGFYFKADMDEEKLSFFVAVSRARERVFFTSTSNARTKTAGLYDLLHGARVPDLGAFPSI